MGVVSDSSTVNVAQVTGNMDGTVVVPTYDWTSFLAEHVVKCTGIKSFHHLRFDSSAPGHVFAREKSDSPEVDINLIKDDWHPSASELPDIVPPKGLGEVRQWYMYHRIREFVDDKHKDATCPKPSDPGAATSTTTSSSLSFSTGPSATTATTVSSPAHSSATTTAPSSATATASSSATRSSSDCAGQDEPRPKRPRLCGVCREAGHNARSCPSRP